MPALSEESSLILEIRRWIENAKGPTADHNSLAVEGCRLAGDCHQRMLACEGRAPREGASLAVAGMELIQQWRATGLALPDWLNAHEEQLCRYGGIWIHQIVCSDRSTEPQLRSAGIHLLDRLDQIHGGSHAWIQNLRRDLNNQLASPAVGHPNDLRVVVVGNIQAFPLFIGLQKALPKARLHHCPSVHVATPQDVQRLHQRLASTDLLVMHRVMPGYRDNIGLDSPTLRQLLPPSARTVVLPSIHYEGHHPWISYAHDPDGRLAALEGESPLGPYHDFLAMVAARDGLPEELLLQPAPPAAVLQRLREHHQQSLAEMQRREAECDLAISDWIAQSHRSLPVAHTINHPTQAALDQLLRRLLQLTLEHRLDPGESDTTEHLGALSVPVHPWVRQALALEDWADGWGQKEGSPLDSHDQLQASLEFYRRHPSILNANTSHPKAELAAQLLSMLRGSSVRVGSSPSGLDPDSLRGPIPYAFLDPRKDFADFQDDQSMPVGSLSWELPLQTYRLGWRSVKQALLLPVGVVTDQGWLCDCLQYLPPNWQQADWIQSVGGYQLSSHGDDLHLIPPLIKEELPLGGRWCVLNDIVAHRNLGHFFHDLLPQLMAIRRLQQRWPDLQILGSVERQPNLRRLRELMLERGWQPRPSSGCHRVEELILQPLAFNGGIGFLGRPDRQWWLAVDDFRDGLKLLRSRLAPDTAAMMRDHWVCFSRDLHAHTETPQGRVFSNYPQLIERLSNAGVVIVDPGHYDIRQLQLLVAGARGFVGIHGAGMFNALLSGTGARVVEIRPACGVWRTVELTCLAAGLDWQHIVCAVDPDEPERSVIPIDSVMDLIT